MSHITMSLQFESERKRKALIYASSIMGALLLIAIIIKWQLPQPVVPPANDFIEVNLGNFEEGSGEVQPLIKGEKAPSDMPSQPEPARATAQPVAEEKEPDNDDPEAAPITKTVKTPTPKVTQPVVTAPPAPKPQKPKIAGYDGPKTGTGNGATEDNGYKYQGNNPNGRGDAGNPNGKPDSYGNNPGGKTGGSGLRVSKGDRKIINNYIFMGDLPKAVIHAIIKVSPEGRGTFVGFDKGTTNSDSRYANAIRSYLPNIKFNTADHESIVTVPFNFTVQQ